MKKLKIFFALLIALACIVTAFTMTISAQENEEAGKTITVSYLNSKNPMSSTTTLDKVAHADGKITVNAGEKFTLPTTADNTYLGQDGYVLVWYTENGRTYMAGEEVSFTEDTRLYRCVAKEVSTKDELQSALQNNSTSAILIADIEATGRVSTKGDGESVIVMNGHNINFTFTNNNTNESLIGTQRSGKYIVGKGTITADDTKNSVGRYSVLQCQSHSHNGNKNMALIGVDVTVNAPEFRLFYDGDVARVSGYPWVKVYGKINVASLGYLSNQAWNSKPRIHIFEGAEVTTSMSKLVFDYYNPTQLVNAQKMCITITGGTFNLPEAASNLNYWTADFSTEYYDDYIKKSYGVEMLNSSNADEIVITGGSFNVKLPDGILANGYECVYNTQTGRYDVEYVACTVNGSNGVHSYTRAEVYENFVPTCDKGGAYYFRCDCGSYYMDTVSELGHNYSIIKITKPATATENGKKLHLCERCDFFDENGSHLDDSCTHGCYYEDFAFVATEALIDVIVTDSGANKTLLIPLSKIYNIVDGVFNGVNSFADPSDPSKIYAPSSIVRLVIPAGITKISKGAIKNMSALEEIVLLDGANATFETESIDTCVNLKKLTLGDCDVVFSQFTVKSSAKDTNDSPSTVVTTPSCPNFSTIDAKNANVTFGAYSFRFNGAMKHILLGEGNTYTFEKYCFQRTSLEEVILPDNSTVSLAIKSFAETKTLKYVYIGKNCLTERYNGKVALGSDSAASIFGGSAVLSKVVLMDVEYIAKWTFSVKTSGDYAAKNDIYIYSHSESLDFNNASGSSSINDRNAFKVYIYTKNVVKNPSNCNYVIYKGLSHQITQTVEQTPPTCTLPGALATGYVTDCPCGVVFPIDSETQQPMSVTYCEVTSKGTGSSIVIEPPTDSEGNSLSIPATGHEFDPERGATVVETTNSTCLNGGTITYKCANCDETQTVANEADPQKAHNVEGVEFVVVFKESCLTEGLKIQNCKDCKLLANSEIIPATGHNANGKWEIIEEGTCTVGETRGQYCANDGCSYVAVSETDAPSGHTPSNNWTVIVEQTCLEGGIKYQCCATCNAICETIETEALGHEFDIEDGAIVSYIKYENGFGKEGVTKTKCLRCDETQDGTVAPIFLAKGYSVNDEGTSLNGGYIVNIALLQAYVAVNGEVEFGVVIANANSFTGSFFNGGVVNSEKALQVAIKPEYTNFDCSIHFNTTSNNTLEFIIAAYVIDVDGSASFIQAENDYAISTTVAENSFTKVTLDLVKANVPQAPVAILPSNDEE